MNEKKCYSVKELQEILMVSRSTIYDLLKKKEFKWGRCKGKYWISKKSFDEWFDGPDKSGNGNLDNPLEEGGRRGVILFEEAFYGKKNLIPQIIEKGRMRYFDTKKNPRYCSFCSLIDIMCRTRIDKIRN